MVKKNSCLKNMLKLLLWGGMVAISALGAVSCSNAKAAKSTEAETAKTADTETSVIPEDEEPLPSLLREEHDFVVGKFNGVDVDTLVAEPVGKVYEHPHVEGEDMRLEWRVYAKNGTVNDIVIGNTMGIHFIEEGDLDGNGTDEWGFIATWPTSSWTSYHLFTYDNNEWKELVESLRICINQIIEINDDYDSSLDPKDTRHNLMINDIARPAKKKGYIDVRYCETNEDVTDWLVKRKRVKANPTKYCW